MTSVAIRADGEPAVSPQGLDVTLQLKAGWRAGDLTWLTLHFEHNAPIRTIAVVIRPSGRSF